MKNRARSNYRYDSSRFRTDKEACHPRPDWICLIRFLNKGNKMDTSERVGPRILILTLPAAWLVSPACECLLTHVAYTPLTRAIVWPWQMTLPVFFFDLAGIDHRVPFTPSPFTPVAFRGKQRPHARVKCLWFTQPLSHCLHTDFQAK